MPPKDRQPQAQEMNRMDNCINIGGVFPHLAVKAVHLPARSETGIGGGGFAARPPGRMGIRSD